MIFLFVFDELQYRETHSKKEDVYRLLRGKNDWSANASAKTLPAIADRLPEIESWVGL